MTPNLQVVVLAHGNGVAAFRRHEKFWLAHEAPLLVICPENDPLVSAHETHKTAQAAHSGEQASQRLGDMLYLLAARPWDQCIIYEYDSFLLVPKLPEPHGLYGITFRNQEAPKFMAPTYVNPPWFVDRRSFDLMMEKARAYPTVKELGFADRFISALAFLAGVPILSYDPPGYSKGTITYSDLPHLDARIKYDHCYAFHGIKQSFVLKAIEDFWDEANPLAT